MTTNNSSKKIKNESLDLLDVEMCKQKKQIEEYTRVKRVADNTTQLPKKSR